MKEDEEIFSSIPSRMKRRSVILVSTDGPLKLKVKQSTIVHTHQTNDRCQKDGEFEATSYIRYPRRWNCEEPYEDDDSYLCPKPGQNWVEISAQSMA